MTPEDAIRKFELFRDGTTIFTARERPLSEHEKAAIRPIWTAILNTLSPAPITLVPCDPDPLVRHLAPALARMQEARDLVETWRASGARIAFHLGPARVVDLYEAETLPCPSYLVPEMAYLMWADERRAMVPDPVTTKRPTGLPVGTQARGAA